MTKRLTKDKIDEIELYLLYLKENNNSCIVLVDRVTNHDEKTIFGDWFWCLICGEVFNIYFDKFKNKIFKCPNDICSSRRGWSDKLVSEIYDKRLKHSDLTNERISWKCSDCNFVWNTAISNRVYGVRSGCPNCSSLANSKGEEKIHDFLEENCIEFISQKTFDGCSHKTLLRFDFYLLDYNLCIEYNGKQHYEPVEYFGGEEQLKDQQNKDQIKRDFCEENDIILFEISYLDFNNIEKILEEAII